MKKLELYQCEICGTQYKDKKACEDCEKHHVKYISVIGAKYIVQSGLPVKVTVKFENGETADYKR